ncbi:type IV pilus assembly protein PilM [Candidatus Omnitrophota bacterium]
MSLKIIKDKLEDLKRIIPREGSEQKPESRIGLDIGSSSIKLVEIHRSKDALRIKKTISKDVGNRQIPSVIKELFSEYKKESRQVSISLSGHGVVTRCIQMPKMPLPEVNQALSFEAEKYIPFSISEVILDCCILEKQPSEEKMLVLFAAAKKTMVDKKIQQVKEAGLEISLIDIDAIAFTNSFNQALAEVANAHSKKGGSIALLNIGSSFCSLNILQGGLPRFMRDIFVGGKDISKRIGNMLGIGFEEAEKIKLNPKQHAEQTNEAAESIFSNLANEVRLSFDYYETQGNPPITALYLSGGGAYFDGTADFFKQNLSIETELWNPFTNLDILPEVNRDELDMQPGRFAIATGLALR